MENPNFSQEGVTGRIKEIMAMPDDQRKQEADKLRQVGLKAYVQNNFTLSETYTELIKNFDDSFADEMTYSIGIAFEKSNWSLIVKFPEADPTPGMRCHDVTQEVSGSGGAGGYNVTKTVGWTWG